MIVFEEQRKRSLRFSLVMITYVQWVPWETRAGDPVLTVLSIVGPGEEAGGLQVQVPEYRIAFK